VKPSATNLLTDADATASAWVIRQAERPLSRAEQHELEAWLMQSDAHRAAYDYAQTAWQGLDRLADEPGRFTDDFAAMSPAAAPRRPLRLAGGMATLAASIAVAVLGTRLWLGNPIMRLQADYATAPAQIATYALADGSKADLAPDSAIALDFTDNERRVTLLAGRAYFTVAPAAANGNRPFVVRAANGSTRALGTQFSVERSDDTVTVTVTEHAVEVVAPLQDRDSRAAIVREGQGLMYNTGGLQAVVAVKADRATAWQRRQLVFDRQTVQEVVTELGRYRRGQILVRDVALAQKRFSGVLDIGDVDGALRIVAEELKADITLMPFVAVLQ
jgi:transmembrane sensor